MLGGSCTWRWRPRFLILATAVNVWLVRVPTAYLLSLTLGLGVTGVHCSMVLDAGARASCHWLRHRAGGWREIEV